MAVLVEEVELSEAAGAFCPAVKEKRSEMDKAGVSTNDVSRVQVMQAKPTFFSALPTNRLQHSTACTPVSDCGRGFGIRLGQERVGQAWSQLRRQKWEVGCKRRE